MSDTKGKKDKNKKDINKKDINKKDKVNNIIIVEGKSDAEYLKKIFAKNFNNYLYKYGKSKADISNDLQINYSTIHDWSTGKKYPRVDKIQLLADYFNTLASNLTDVPVNNRIPVLGSIPARYTY